MTEFGLPGGAVLGLMPETGIRRLLPSLPYPASARGAPRAELYLVVTSPTEALARALAAGATAVSPVLPRDWGDDAGYCLDPDGHLLAFAAPNRATIDRDTIDCDTIDRDTPNRDLAQNEGSGTERGI